MIIYKRFWPRLLSKWIVSILRLYVAWYADPTHHAIVHAVNGKLNSNRTNLSCMCCRAQRVKSSVPYVELCALEFDFKQPLLHPVQELWSPLGKKWLEETSSASFLSQNVSLQKMFRIWQVAFGSYKVGKIARGGTYIHVAFYVLRNTRALSTDCTIWWAVSLTAVLLKLLEALLWILIGEGMDGV